MNYLKAYSDLCNTRKLMQEERLLFKENGDYFERHHIKPRCTGGSNDGSNMVLLSAREHFIAHYLLYRMVMTNEVPSKVKRDLIFAIISMKGNTKKMKGQRYFNSRLYEKVKISWSSAPMPQETREKISLALKGKKKSLEHRRKLAEWQIGRKLPEKTIQKMRGNTSWIGRKHTEETKQKISISLTGRKLSDATKESLSKIFKGRIVSEEVRQKMREGKAKVKYLTCPYCQKCTDPGNSKQFHFENCKMVPLSEYTQARIEKEKYKRSAQARDRQSTINKKQSESLKKLPALTCPYCNKSCNPSNAKRWHFDNCKLAPQVNHA